MANRHSHPPHNHAGRLTQPEARTGDDAKGGASPTTRRKIEDAHYRRNPGMDEGSGHGSPEDDAAPALAEVTDFLGRLRRDAAASERKRRDFGRRVTALRSRLTVCASSPRHSLGAGGGWASPPSRPPPSPSRGPLSPWNGGAGPAASTKSFFSSGARTPSKRTATAAPLALTLGADEGHHRAFAFPSPVSAGRTPRAPPPPSPGRRSVRTARAFAVVPITPIASTRSAAAAAGPRTFQFSPSPRGGAFRFPSSPRVASPRVAGSPRRRFRFPSSPSCGHGPPAALPGVAEVASLGQTSAVDEVPAKILSAVDAALATSSSAVDDAAMAVTSSAVDAASATTSSTVGAASATTSSTVEDAALAMTSSTVDAASAMTSSSVDEAWATTLSAVDAALARTSSAVDAALAMTSSTVDAAFATTSPVDPTSATISSNVDTASATTSSAVDAASAMRNKRTSSDASFDFVTTNLPEKTSRQDPPDKTRFAGAAIHEMKPERPHGPSDASGNVAGPPPTPTADKSKCVPPRTPLDPVERRDDNESTGETSRQAPATRAGPDPSGLDWKDLRTDDPRRRGRSAAKPVPPATWSRRPAPPRQPQEPPPPQENEDRVTPIASTLIAIEQKNEGSDDDALASSVAVRGSQSQSTQSRKSGPSPEAEAESSRESLGNDSLDTAETPSTTAAAANENASFQRRDVRRKPIPPFANTTARADSISSISSNGGTASEAESGCTSSRRKALDAVPAERAEESEKASWRGRGVGIGRYRKSPKKSTANEISACDGSNEDGTLDTSIVAKRAQKWEQHKLETAEKTAERKVPKDSKDRRPIPSVESATKRKGAASSSGVSRSWKSGASAGAKSRRASSGREARDAAAAPSTGAVRRATVENDNAAFRGRGVGVGPGTQSPKKSEASACAPGNGAVGDGIVDTNIVAKYARKLEKQRLEMANKNVPRDSKDHQLMPKRTDAKILPKEKNASDKAAIFGPKNHDTTGNDRFNRFRLRKKALESKKRQAAPQKHPQHATAPESEMSAGASPRNASSTQKKEKCSMGSTAKAANFSRSPNKVLPHLESKKNQAVARNQQQHAPTPESKISADASTGSPLMTQKKDDGATASAAKTTCADGQNTIPFKNLSRSPNKVLPRQVMVNSNQMTSHPQLAAYPLQDFATNRSTKSPSPPSWVSNQNDQGTSTMENLHGNKPSPRLKTNTRSQLSPVTYSILPPPVTYSIVPPFNAHEADRRIARPAPIQKVDRRNTHPAPHPPPIQNIHEPVNVCNYADISRNEESKEDVIIQNFSDVSGLTLPTCLNGRARLKVPLQSISPSLYETMSPIARHRHEQQSVMPGLLSPGAKTSKQRYLERINSAKGDLNQEGKVSSRHKNIIRKVKTSPRHKRLPQHSNHNESTKSSSSEWKEQTMITEHTAVLPSSGNNLTSSKSNSPGVPPVNARGRTTKREVRTSLDDKAKEFTACIERQLDDYKKIKNGLTQPYSGSHSSSLGHDDHFEITPARSKVRFGKRTTKSNK